MNANPLGAIDAKAGGYEAGAFNRMEQTNINSYQLEKSYVHSLDHIQLLQ